MSRRTSLVVAALAVGATIVGIATLPGGSAEAGGGVRPGLVIRKPGTYVLPRDIVSDLTFPDGALLVIDAAGVNIDLNRHTIGTSRTTGTLIRLTDRARGARIRNGTLRGGLNAIAGTTSGESRLEDLTIEHTAGTAISITNRQWLELDECCLVAPGAAGIVLDSDVDGAVGFKMHHVTVTDSVGAGVVIDGRTSNSHASLENVQVDRAGATGIQVSRIMHVTARMCSVTRPFADGLSLDVFESASVDYCHVAGAGRNGMSMKWEISGGTGDADLYVRDSIVIGAMGRGIQVNQTGVARLNIDVSRNRISRTAYCGIYVWPPVAGASLTGVIQANAVSNFGIVAASGPLEASVTAGINIATALVDNNSNGVRRLDVSDNHVTDGNGNAAAIGIAASLRGSRLEGNRVAQVGLGILVRGNNDSVSENVVTDVVNAGIVAQGVGHAIRGNTSSGNGTGIRLVNATSCVVQENHLAGNTSKGCVADDASNIVKSNTILGGGLTGGTAVPGNVIVP